ncbi:MAG TPA: hypothetical protein VL242_44235 [Sorangium sp.]|nr:hypothetical protein [Sorangium sp.]
MQNRWVLLLWTCGLLGALAAACSPGDGGESSGGSGGSDACGCVEDAVRWGSRGGFGADKTSTLSPCRTFSYEQRAPGSDVPRLTCSQELLSCEESVSAGEVAAAFDHPDVVAALAAAPVLYGVDARELDGRLFRIERGDAAVDVGYDCQGRAGCVPIPDGVAALVELLGELEREQLALVACQTAMTR